MRNVSRLWSAVLPRLAAATTWSMLVVVGSACSDDPDVTAGPADGGGTPGAPVWGDAGPTDDLGGAPAPGDATAEDAGSDDGAASDAGCTPGETRCATPLSIETCLATAEDWQETACPDDEGCVDGGCVPQVCTPGQSSGVCLDDDSYERCNDSGTAIETVTCGLASYCFKGTCIPQLCEPGMTICKSFGQLKVCNEDGTAWLDGDYCPTGSLCDQGVCLSPCEVNIKDGSYLGCEYWAMDLDNIEESEFQTVGVVVSVPPDTSGTDVLITNNATGATLPPQSLGVANTYVAAGDTKVFKLPLGYDVDGTQITNRTFKIETTSPVIVHQFNPLNADEVFTNDASLLLPSKVTGSEYLVMSWAHRVDPSFTLRGFATVVATEPGTTVVGIEPTSDIVASGPGVGITPVAKMQSGKPYAFVLSQGQALQIQTDGETGADLTGTAITASQRVSVTGGHECANVPLGIGACDHLEQQLFPVETWSNDYVADAFQPRSPSQIDVWRVMAGDNDVTVTTTPPVPGFEEFVLQRGAWVQFATKDSFRILADGKIMVGHFLTGSKYPGAEIVCEANQTAIGDPAFTLAAPVKRYLDEYAVLTPSGYQENYLNIVLPEGAQATIDGTAVNATPSPIGTSGFGIVRLSVAPGIHTVAATEPFGLTAYGYACDVSYAYPGGLKLQALSGAD